MRFFTTLLFLILIQLKPTLAQQPFAKGADIGWLSEMEAAGRKFYNKQGQQKDPLDILSEYCINSIRLRVWVNPVNGYSNQTDVVNLAQRATAKGFRIMIDFHYSDHWADPGKQTKPATWATYSITQLNEAIYNHTYTVLNALKTAGITPEWVQIGNETNNGMLWPEGQASTNMGNYAAFVTSGHNAAKAVFPSIITIVHVANGFDNALFRWNIGGLVSNGAKFDAIGMSLYPEPGNWQTLVDQCNSNMLDMINRYNKKIIISEIGLSISSEVEAKSFVKDIINKNMALPNQMGLGVFWWEPLAYNWQGYDKVAWNNNGRPTMAMEGFGTNCLPTQINKLTFQVDMTGQNTSAGVYITGTMVNWQITPMQHVGNNIYSFAMNSFPGDTGAYYFLNANNWEARETVPLECATYWDKDRGFEMPENDIVLDHTWGSCNQIITGNSNHSTDNNIQIYPNPFYDTFTIKEFSDYKYSIYDQTGTLIEKGNGNSELSIGKNLLKGNYILKIQTDNDLIIRKLIKN